MTMVEENEKFKQSRRNLKLKTQTLLGNSGRNYNGDEYSGNMTDLINKTTDILGKGEARNFEITSVFTNEVEPSLSIKEDKTDPESALSGFYNECLLHLSYPCIQRKMLVYIDRFDRMKGFGIFDDYLTAVRIRNTSRRPLMTEKNLDEPRMNTGDTIYKDVRISSGLLT